MNSSSSREFQIINHHPRLQVNEDALLQCLQSLDEWNQYPLPEGELSLVFITEDEMCRLHEEYLNDPKLTDVITFDGDPTLDFAGEVLLSPDQARIQAPLFNTSFSAELLLYVVHGWLHLAGHDDTTEDALPKMKNAEQDCMHHLSDLAHSVFVWQD
jgi:probable rRNA maturation factor